MVKIVIKYIYLDNILKYENVIINIIATNIFSCSENSKQNIYLYLDKIFKHQNVDYHLLMQQVI